MEERLAREAIQACGTRVGLLAAHHTHVHAQLPLCALQEALAVGSLAKDLTVQPMNQNCLLRAGEGPHWRTAVATPAKCSTPRARPTSCGAL